MLVSRDASAKRVAETTVGDYWVSTVWLGLDHAQGGPPLIFETMVGCARANGGWMSWQMRYSTEEDALLGHAEAVARYSKSDEVRDAEDRLRGDHFDDLVFQTSMGSVYHGKNELGGGKE